MYNLVAIFSINVQNFSALTRQLIVFGSKVFTAYIKQFRYNPTTYVVKSVICIAENQF